MEETAVTQRTAAVLMDAHEKQQAIDEMNVRHGSTTTGIPIAMAPVAESPKVSVMAPKAGISFVIPKNKLSGALVPVVKGGGKWEQNEVKKEEDPKQPSRKTKWGPDLTQDPVVKRGRALALQTRAEQIAAQLESGNLELDNNEATRSPSPPPIYDSNGQRLNTREGRKREQLDLERREAIGECLRLNPSYKPPSGYKAVYKEAKLFIPARDYPGYNFIGLILGPRGNTQKRMEAETGTKIAIRGKGAVKEGKLQTVRRDGKELDGAFEDLHVHITADTFEKVDAAVALIEPLLTPVDEDRNTHKRKQLRELAEMNGTIRDYTKACTLCGEIGHREWQCPKDKLTTFQAKVFCQICGDGGHPSIDCPMKLKGQGKVLDKEYLNFLEELGTGLGGTAPLTKAVDTGSMNPSGSGLYSATTNGPHGAAFSMADSEPNSNIPTEGISGPQPMLLTASGAQPMPTGWTASAVGSEPTSGFSPRAAVDGGSEIAGFSGFPFPIPRPGRGGRGGFNFFLPPFFHPALTPLGGVAFFGGRPPLPFPGNGFHPMMALGPRGLFQNFRQRHPFPPFGFRPELRPPPTSTTPNSQPISSPMERPVQEGLGQESRTPDLQVQGGGSQASPELFGGPEAVNVLFNESNSQAASLTVSTFSSATVPSFSSATARPFSSVTVPTFSSPTPPPALPPSAPAPSPVLPPSALPPALPPAGPPPVLPPVRPPVPSVRPAFPSVRPAVPPVAPPAPPSTPPPSNSSSFSSLSIPGSLPGGLQTPSFTPVGAIRHAPLAPVSSWDGTSTSTPTTSNMLLPPQPWANTAVPARPTWPQAQPTWTNAPPQHSSPHSFSWQQQAPRYPSPAVDNPSPSRLMGNAPPLPPLPSPPPSVPFPRHSSLVVDNSSSKPWGNAPPPPAPPTPPASAPPPPPLPPPPPAQTLSFTPISPALTTSPLHPVVPSFMPRPPPLGSQGNFMGSSLPGSIYPNMQPPEAVAGPRAPSFHSSNFSSPRLVSPPQIGPQIRPSTLFNSMPSVPVGDPPAKPSLSQPTPVSQQSLTFSPQKISTVSPWQHPYIQVSVHPRSQASTEFGNSTAHRLDLVKAGLPPLSSAFPASAEDAQGFNRPLLFHPQTVLDKGNSYSYDPLVPTSTLSTPPIVVHRQHDLQTGASLDQGAVATGDFLGVSHITSSMNIRSGAQQAWMQPVAATGQKVWSEHSLTTGSGPQLPTAGLPQTQEVDPEYEKLMASVGVT